MKTMVSLFLFITALAFSTHVWAVTITSTLDTTPPSSAPSYTATTGVQGVRMFRDSIASTCAAPKSFPGTTQPGSRQFDAYTFTAFSSGCVTVTLSAANGVNLFTAAYNSSGYVPSDLGQNYLADAGASAGSRTYSFNVTAGETFTVVVYDVPPVANGSGSVYTLDVSGVTLDFFTQLDFNDGQYTACFTDVRRGPDINDNNAPDLGGTGHTALNFTGGAGPAGDTWLTKWTPNGATRICGSTLVLAEILIHTFNNTKGAGLVTLLDSAPGGKGLALILYDQGNSDALQLATIDPATGKLTKITSVSLGAAIAENTWYRLAFTLAISTDELSVAGQVFRHATPMDPNSPVVIPPFAVLFFEGSLSALGLEDAGE